MSPFTAKVVGSLSSAPKRTLLAALAHACCASVSQATGAAGVATGGGFGGPAPTVGSIQWLLEVRVGRRKKKKRMKRKKKIYSSAWLVLSFYSCLVESWKVH